MNKSIKPLCIFFSLLILCQALYSKSTNNSFFQIKVYHLKDSSQLKLADNFLKNAYLPALHRFGMKNIGVFKPVGNDTASVKFIYVLIPFSSADEWMKISGRLNSDAAFKLSAKSFLGADAKNPGFERMESILLEAFSGQPYLVLPKQKNQGRIFELRSYESPTENLLEKKMAMFNTAGEIQIFNRLGFDPVFYAKVISGSHMPNLMYMPVFDNVQQRNEQWKKFGEDAKWKEISTMPENENDVSVSHIDSVIMHSTEYSDY